MSLRPNRSGVSPRSSRARRLSESRARALTFSRTFVAPPPRCRGSSSPAHVLAAPASHGWEIPVNDSRPGWPNTARSQSSPDRSRAGSVSARRTSRATATRNTRVALVDTPSVVQAPTVGACCRRSVSQTARRITSCTFAPPWTRCWTPNNTSMTTSGGSPRRLTCPPCETAVAVDSQRRWSVSGSATTAVRHRT